MYDISTVERIIFEIKYIVKDKHKFPKIMRHRRRRLRHVPTPGRNSLFLKITKYITQVLIFKRVPNIML